MSIREWVGSRVLARPRQLVKEIIGRIVLYAPFWQGRIFRSVDRTQTDYQFWDNLRRGKAKGFELSGLFALPIAQIIASWVIGKLPTLKLAGYKKDEAATEESNEDYTNTRLARFMQRIHGLIQGVVVDLYGLGDQYLMVNPNGSISIISPETIELEHDPLDYRKIVKGTITTKLDKALVKDEYRLDGRTLTIQWYARKDELTGEAVPAKTDVYPFENLIGRLPFTHWKNDASANEVFGRPIIEPCYRLFSRYDDLLEKAIDGAELSGNPIPVFEGLVDIDETIEKNSTIEDEDYTDDDGNAETRRLIKFDRLSTIFLGEGGRFHFASPPGGFTNDITAMLRQLFMMILHFTRIPEYMWGGEIASGRASTMEQQDPFVQYIEARQLQIEGQGADEDLGLEALGGLLELADIWLRTRRLVDPRIVVRPVECDWPELTSEDKATLFNWVKWLADRGDMTSEKAVELSGTVDDAAAEVAKARGQRAKSPDNDDFQARMDQALDEARNNVDRSNVEPEPDEDPNDMRERVTYS